MKAYVLHNINDLRYEEIPVPVPQEERVLVEVRAAGICGSDIPRIYSTGTYSYPLVPGHEFAGVVTEKGRSVEDRWLGRRIGVFPLMPCGKCMQCRAHQYEMCENYGYLGSRNHGGFAEYAEVPVWNLIALPDNVSFEQAAMLEPMAVAVHAIRKSGIVKENSAVVCGLGTIGLLTIMFLQELGCRKILAIGNKAFQKTYVLKLGLSEKCCYSGISPEAGDTEDSDCREECLELLPSAPGSAGKAEYIREWILGQTDGNGADVFFDCAGTPETLSYALSGTAAGGTVQLVGNPASDMMISKAAFARILRRQLTLRGSWNSAFDHAPGDDWHYALERLADGRIHPEWLITHKLPFGELQKGFALMHDKSEGYVKVMGVRENA